MLSELLMKEAIVIVAGLVEDGYHYMEAVRFVSDAYGLPRGDTSLLKAYREAQS